MVKNQRNSCCHMGCPPMIGDSHFHRGYSLRSQKSKPLGNHGIISVGRSKGGANIAASIPGHLGVIFQVQQEPFFHQATKGLPCRTRAACFPTGKPSRDALPSNFEQIDTAYSRLRHELVPPMASISISKVQCTRSTSSSGNRSWFMIES